MGTPLNDQELRELDVRMPDGATAVWGATLDGEPVVRAATAESRLALIGEYATGFDAGGPSATLCRECSRLLYADTAGDLSSLQSRHLSVEHGISAPMLP
ncbi:hypothetical protein H7J07_05950 [Mycobacterium koreense]|uniref:Uncharacterized protein n=1 Tax=Mycolicibacillus koreensis TaxID=1069220 RepID=A0A7I7SB91_9MYCO|nr:hypothetical protein [Mycolicibacillus koreensis]MCV7247769.1 hypothetical protein [Mycolicibacillus koreensis]OSC34712.1 hypothetical protein B8W67_05540 [Mycolicibacillus koreensis]BBY54152.1 hypothetical protein MKOR_14030 [Mycolicibacillus koreensis]